MGNIIPKNFSTPLQGAPAGTGEVSKEETMATYTITETTTDSTTTLKLSFGPEQGQNDRIVKDAVAALETLNLEGGKLVKLNGPASLPVAVAIAHAVAHKYGAVSVFDPKLGKYVVAVSHDPDFQVGDLID